MADDVSMPGNPQQTENADVLSDAPRPGDNRSDKLKRVLVERLRSQPVVNRQVVEQIRRLLRNRRLRFDEDHVAKKFLELEAIING